MAKSRRRDSKREACWRGVVTRQAGSGLGAVAFCKREGVPESSFYAWRRTIKGRDGESGQAGPDAFVPAGAAFVPTRGALVPTPADFVPVVLRQDDMQQPPRLCAGMQRPEQPERVGESITIELCHGRVMRLPGSMPAEQIAAIVGALEDRHAAGQGAA